MKTWSEQNETCKLSKEQNKKNNNIQSNSCFSLALRRSE